VSRYHLSKIAKEDLLGIFLHTLDTWGEEQLPIYQNLLEKAMDRIADNPDLPGSKARPDLSLNCRMFRIGMHVIVYRERHGSLEIARILHQSMDFIRHVSEENYS
jgi:toxin ParE1/3/4